MPPRGGRGPQTSPRDRANLACHPLTPDRWGDLELLFGPERGAVAGCWCMWFKLSRPQWEARGRAGRKAAFRAEVEAGPPPGILAYAGTEPVGWCAVAPRSAYPAIERSRITRPVDARPAFAITCFYLAPRWRRRGLMRPMIEAALAFAKEQGAVLVEAYPLDPPIGERPSGAFRGIPGPFRDLGFVEVARRSPTRPILRRELA
ncbi:GNAT family N-acetyltransferase [Benzoatithermus flavus]|uniref:GNAT family N-acetyltransferase n=1 Tax=Benzoatithermus flavus TaxID=3108223 RepID=A0ABU8XMI6_9PROT